MDFENPSLNIFMLKISCLLLILFSSIPLIFFQILINFFGGFFNNFKTVFPNFINEISLRLFSCLILLFYFLEYVNFYGFMVAFVSMYGLAALNNFFNLLHNQQLKLKL